jgi:integrase
MAFGAFFRTVDELCKAIAAVPAAWRAHITVMMLTGLRWGEFVAIQWPDINLDAGKLTVCRSIPVRQS